LNFLEDTAKGAQHPSLLDPCLLWPRSPISATAVLLVFNVLLKVFHIPIKIYFESFHFY